MLSAEISIESAFMFALPERVVLSEFLPETPLIESALKVIFSALAVKMLIASRKSVRVALVFILPPLDRLW